MKKVIVPAFIFAITIAFTIDGWAQSRNSGENFDLASGKVGASSHLAGLALEAITKLGLSEGADLQISLKSTSGLEENLTLLQSGGAAFAISDGVLAHLAYRGEKPFAGAPNAELRGVAALWQEVEHFVVRDDQVDTGTIVDLQKIAPRRILQYDPNGGGMHSLLYLFSRIGSGVGDPFKLALVEEPDLAAEVLDKGEAGSLYLMSAEPSTFAEATWDRTKTKLRFLEFTGRQLESITGGVPVWTSHVVAPGSYAGQDYPIYTTARATLLVTRADVPDIVVYQVLQALDDNKQLLQNFSPEPPLASALTGIPVPLHSGALRYYREAGKLPEDLLTVPEPAELAKVVRSFEPVVTAAAPHGGGQGEGGHGASHAGHSDGGGAEHPGHVHDEGMLSRARAEIHSGVEVLKISRPEQLGYDAEIFKIYFGLGQSGLDADGQEAVAAATRSILGMFERYGKEPEVYVEGHTDRTGNWRTNFELAHKRAASVRDALAAKGIREDWIHISDYAEDRVLVPTADGVDERRNRRVEITVIPPQQSSKQAPRPDDSRREPARPAPTESDTAAVDDSRSDEEAQLFESFREWLSTNPE